MGYTDQELTDGFNALNQDTRDMIQGYVAGFNRRIGEIAADSSLLPFEFGAIATTLGVAP